jgi:vanillate O-demethylase ferredoxin subunit
MKAILTQTARGSHVYLCGPPSLVTAATDLCRVLGYGNEQVHFELFSPAAAPQGGQSFSVYLARSDKSLIIPADKTLLDGLVEAGCAPHNDCRQGRCGSCVVAVIDGVPEHRDTFLSAAERATNTLICTCISRARTAHLILDL